MNNNEWNELDNTKRGSTDSLESQTVPEDCKDEAITESSNVESSDAVPVAEESGHDSGTWESPVEHLNHSSFYKENHSIPQKKKHGVFLQMLAVSLISSILGGAVAGSYLWFAAPGFATAAQSYNSRDTVTGNSQTNSGLLSNVSMETSSTGVSAIADKLGPSIVGIKTTASSLGRFGLEESGGEGSGIIYSSDGYVVTNYHVVESAVDTSSKSIAKNAKVEVVLPSDKDKYYEATLVGYDSKTDLAVIKIQASNLPAVEFGDSDNLKVGETAIAIGNPGGLEYMGSVTMGIISGLNRTIETESGSQKLIQTDVAINPGNSGGALVNSKGQVVGINSVKIVADGYEGLGFAIPSNTVKEITDSLINYKYVKGRPSLGISVDQRFNAQLAQQYNMPEGVYVKEVTPLSGAYKAGIEAGDIITRLDGQAVTSYDELSSVKNTHKPGDTVSVEIYRDGKTMTVQVKLDEDRSN